MRSIFARLTLGLLICTGFASPLTAQESKTKAAHPIAKKRSTKVDLNKASSEELQELPGIGPVRADEIIKARPFKQVSDLKTLKGISSELFEALHSHLTVSEVTQKKAMPRATTSKTENSAPATSKGKLNLNTSTLEQLQELPGIGPARAAEIVKARPIKEISALKSLKGISDDVYAGLVPLVTIAESNPKIPAVKESMPKTATKSTSKKVITKTAVAKEADHEDEAQHISKKKAAIADGRKININTATTDELQELPGIGPVRSAAIIKERPFEKIEDVMKVEGIKDGIFAHIKDHISVK